MNIYPSDYPKPLRGPYRYGVDMGINRTELGFTTQRQRRLFNTMPHLVDLSFAMKIENFNSWVQWVNEYAFKYFILKAFAYSYGPCADYYVRFAGDYSVAPLSGNALVVNVQADLRPVPTVNDAPVNPCDVFYNNTYWQQSGSNYITWSGSQWDLSTTSGTQELAVIQSGLNDNWEVGYTKDLMRVSINGGDTLGGDSCYVEIFYSGGNSGSISHAFTSVNEIFDFEFDMSTFTGDLQRIDVLFFPSGYQTNAAITNIEFCPVES